MRALNRVGGPRDLRRLQRLIRLLEILGSFQFPGFNQAKADSSIPTIKTPVDLIAVRTSGKH